jgi:putative intracellular protease/amidase
VHFALVVYPQFEVLDAFGPTEVLHCLGSPSVYPESQNIQLSIIGPDLGPVSTGPIPGDPSPVSSRVSQTIVPTHTFDNPPDDVDVLIVPGGFGAGPKSLFGGEWEPPCAEMVVASTDQARLRPANMSTAVCNGAGLAARAGILDGQKATTNKKLWADIVSTGPKTHWIAQAR